MISSFFVIGDGRRHRHSAGLGYGSFVVVVMMLLPAITTIIGPFFLCVSVPCRTASDIRCASSVIRRRASFVVSLHRKVSSLCSGTGVVEFRTFFFFFSLRATHLHLHTGVVIYLLCPDSSVERTDCARITNNVFCD